MVASLHTASRRALVHLHINISRTDSFSLCSLSYIFSPAARRVKENRFKLEKTEKSLAKLDKPAAAVRCHINPLNLYSFIRFILCRAQL